MQGQQLIMIGSHGNGRWMAMEGVFIMVGRCGGDQNLGFNFFIFYFLLEWMLDATAQSLWGPGCGAEHPAFDPTADPLVRSMRVNSFVCWYCSYVRMLGSC